MGGCGSCRLLPKWRNLLITASLIRPWTDLSQTYGGGETQNTLYPNQWIPRCGAYRDDLRHDRSRNRRQYGEYGRHESLSSCIDTITGYPRKE